MKTSRFFTGGVLAAVLLLVGCTVPAATEDSAPAALSFGEEVTILGTAACLPRKGDGPATMECKFGLQNGAGDHYDLDLSAIDLEEFPAFFLQMGETARVSGTLVEADPQTPYDVLGLVIVDELELLED